MKNFSDAEIGITRSDLRRMIEYWYNEECNKYNDKRRIELVRISPDAKYVLRFNVLSPQVVSMGKEREAKKAEEAA